jgi:hypothetical protein
MNRSILTCLAVLAFTALPCPSEEKRFSPLRPQILSAKTACLAGGPPDVLDKAYAELTTWNRFQVVSDPAQADVIFEFAYGPSTTPALWSETLTITDAKTKEALYEDGRVISTQPPSGAVPAVVGAFRHHSMALDMLKDLRKRIEATEAARTLEYTIQLEARAAKYFTDAAVLEDKLVATSLSLTDSSKDTAKDVARKWREFADQLSKSNSEMTKFLGHATTDDLLSKHNSEEVRKYRDEILSYTCGIVKVNQDLRQQERSNLPPDFLHALEAETADAAALSPDCSSELAISLMKQQAGKPPGN